MKPGTRLIVSLLQLIRAMHTLPGFMASSFTPLIVLPVTLLGLVVLQAPAAELRLGMVGLDTGHVIEFTKILHAPAAAADFSGVRIVGGVPAASRDIESSWTKEPGYTERLQRDFGVKIYATVEELLPHVDGMLIESVDARP